MLSINEAYLAVVLAALIVLGGAMCRSGINGVPAAVFAGLLVGNGGGAHMFSQLILLIS